MSTQVASEGLDEPSIAGVKVITRSMGELEALVDATATRTLDVPDPAKSREALASLESGALDLGKEGPDPTYGKGLVGADLRAGRRE